jgi:pimeloyl-ACP methyl ester carboxylesterase
MSTYVLLPGAGSDSFYWHLVTPRLTALGHRVVAVDLPTEDESAGLTEYADIAVDAIGDVDGDELVVVAQSMGAFTGPLLCDRVPVSLLVLLCPMTPAPGESAGDWWDNTGSRVAYREAAARDGRSVDGEFDPVEIFFHDVPEDVRAAVFARGERGQSEKSFHAPFPLAAWPDVPTRFLLGTADRLFPPEFQRRVAAERLGLVPDEIGTGHLAALADPAGLVDRLEGYRRSL